MILKKYLHEELSTKKVDKKGNESEILYILPALQKRSRSW
jgi:hypothetical protein